MTDVFSWAQLSTDKTPRDLLLQHGYERLATALEQVKNLKEKQRDGVYGTMRLWGNVLSYEQVIPRICDTGVACRPQPDHKSLATSTDTLFLISRESDDSARAITAALAMVVLPESEKTLAIQPNGRLKTPLLAVHDLVKRAFAEWRVAIKTVRTRNIVIIYKVSRPMFIYPDIIWGQSPTNCLAGN